MVRLDKKWFNPLYFILNDLVKDENIRTILVYGGKSSSKTISITQLLTKECYVKEASSISFRKEGTTIKTTLKKSFNLAIKSTRLGPGFENLEFLYRCEKGSEMVLKGMDDSEKAKGVESYKYLYFDELNQFFEEEFEQANLSLRGIPGQKLFASWNPVDESSWVKTNLVDKYEWVETDYKLPCEHSFVRKSKCGKVILIKTTYEDNFWVSGSPDGTYGYRDKNLIAEYAALKNKNYNSYRINVLGEWGKVVYGGEFLKCWKSETHVGLYPYNPNLAVYLYFDENVNPYFPCGIFQCEDVFKETKQPGGTISKEQIGTNVFLIHAIAAKNPNNTTKWMGRELVRKLTEWGHKEKVYIGGDPTSQKEDVKQEKGHDFFRLMIAELAQFKPERHTLTTSPSVRMSADFFNSILESEACGIKFRADHSCRIAISDYENTKEDKNGKVDKKTVTDPATKVSYQPWGHFCDLTRYFLCRTFPDEYLKYQKGGISLPLTIGKIPSRNRY